MFDALPIDGGPASLAIFAIVMVAAGFVRGYSGFGSAAVIVTALSPFYPPILIVPLAVLVEVFASLLMVRSVRGQIDWSLLKFIVIGALVGSPIGLMTHFYLSEDAVRLTIQGFVLIIAIALLAGWSLKSEPGKGGLFGVGILSGIANTAASLGGLPVALFLVASAKKPQLLRATMVVFFFFVNAITITLMVSTGVMGFESVKLLAVGALPFALGIYAGSKFFSGAKEATFRKIVIALLIALALIGITRTVMG
ncbi:MAG: sulfite exporter TauE/SafE family protein [Hyphomicrobiales bacterium]